MYKWLLLSLCFFIASTNISRGQCCSHGCSTTSDRDDGVLEKNNLEAASSFKYSRSEKYYDKDSPVEFSYLKYSYFNYTGLGISYGITSRYTAGAEIGYFFEKTQRYVFNDWELQGNGLGDLIINNRYALIRQNSHKYSFSLGAGLRFPTGSYRQSINGVLLSRDVQSGTGAYGFEPSFYLRKSYRDTSWKIMLNGEASFNTTNPDNYHYGSDYNIAFMGIKQFNSLIGLLMQIKGELHQDDKLIIYGEEQKSGGYKKIVLIPQLTIDWKRWVMSFAYEFPVYQYFNGVQFANAYVFSVDISKTFSLHNKQIKN